MWSLTGNMTEGSMMGVEREEYVEVMQNYSYQREDRTLHMTKGEILMLLKRSTGDWWQVGQLRLSFLINWSAIMVDDF